MSTQSSKTRLTSEKKADSHRKATPALQPPATMSTGTLQRAVEDPAAARPPPDILTFQQRYGDQAVQGLLAGHSVQAKLTVGPAGDHYEQEADRVADQVMVMAAPPSASPKHAVQRAAGVSI